MGTAHPSIAAIRTQAWSPHGAQSEHGAPTGRRVVVGHTEAGSTSLTALTSGRAGESWDAYILLWFWTEFTRGVRIGSKYNNKAKKKEQEAF